MQILNQIYLTSSLIEMNAFPTVIKIITLLTNYLHNFIKTAHFIPNAPDKNEI